MRAHDTETCELIGPNHDGEEKNAMPIKMRKTVQMIFDTEESVNMLKVHDTTTITSHDVDEAVASCETL